MTSASVVSQSETGLRDFPVSPFPPARCRWKWRSLRGPRWPLRVQEPRKQALYPWRRCAMTGCERNAELQEAVPRRIAGQWPSATAKCNAVDDGRTWLTEICDSRWDSATAASGRNHDGHTVPAPEPSAISGPDTAHHLVDCHGTKVERSQWINCCRTLRRPKWRNDPGCGLALPGRDAARESA